MSRAKDAILNIVSSLSANMAAGPLASVLNQFVGGAVGIAALELPSAETGQCVAYGTLLVGSAFVQACRGEKVEGRDAARMASVERALRKLAAKQDEARQELADFAWGQEWVREELEKQDDHPAVEMAFQNKWRSQVVDLMVDLGINIDGIKQLLDNVIVIDWDTNTRVREIQSTTAQIDSKADAILTEAQQTSAAIQQIVSQLEQLQQPTTGGSQLEIQLLRDQLASATRRYIQAASLHGRGWREAVNDLRHAPRKLAEFLVTATSQMDADFVDRHLETAAVWTVMGELDKAMASLQKAIAIQPNNPVALTGLAHAHMLRAEYDEAVRLISIIMETTHDEQWGAICIGNIGVMERLRGNFAAAEARHTKSLAIHVAAGRLDEVATQLCNLGVICREYGDWQGAWKHLEESLSISMRLGNQPEIARNLVNLADVACFCGDLNRADQILCDALGIAEQLQWTEGLSSIYSTMGIVELKREHFDKARILLNKSISLDTALGRKDGLARQLGNMSALEMKCNNWELAEHLARRSWDLGIEIGNLAIVSSAIGNLAGILLSQGKLNEAEHYLVDALELSQKQNNWEGIVTQSMNMAAIAWRRKDWDKARLWWTLAKDQCVKTNTTHLLRRIQGFLDRLDNVHSE